MAIYARQNDEWYRVISICTNTSSGWVEIDGGVDPGEKSGKLRNMV